MKTNNRLSIIIFLLLCSTMATAQTVFRGTVIDAVTKQPIVNARVGINNQGVGEITNTKGFFNYKKHHEVLNSESELQVGATGYESIRLDAEKVRTLFNRSSKIELQPSSKQQKNRAVNNLTVFWDVSEDMQGRDVEAEIAYVKEYVSVHKNLTLRLVVFDYQIRSEERIEIRGGDIIRFRESVKGLIYNGPSNYDVLDIAGADAVILSSNGNPNYGTLDVSQDIPVYAIAGEEVAVKGQYMKALALYTQGNFTTLQAYNGSSSQGTVAVQKTKSIKEATIQGNITSLGKPLQEVSIIKKGDFTEYLTKADGSFELPATEGDILQFRYLGMFPKDVLVSDQKSINIELLPENNVLDEVVLVKKIEKIIVGDKEIRGRRIPNIPGGVTGALDRYITAEDITPNAKTLEYVIRENFKRVRISYTPLGVQLIIKGVRPNFYIDGRKILNIDEALAIVDTDIESIVIKDSPTTTSRYGPIIPGFAVIVTTKSVALSKEKRGNSALVKGNDYTEEVTPIATTALNQSSKLQITGIVKDPKGFLADATITRKGSFDEVYTNAQGRFEMRASLGDVLVVSKVGMFTKEVLIESQNMGTIELTPKNDQLDEVVLSGDKRVDNTIESSDGRRVNKDKLGYAADELTENDFSAGATNLQQLITGKVAGVSVEGGLYSGSQVVYKIRGGNLSITNQIPPIWIVNGIPYQDPPDFLDVQQIASITVLKSASATSRYGSLAAGGAFLVKTKEVSFQNKAKKAQKSALVSGNEYTESSTRTIDVSSLPEYILRLREIPKLKDQFELYQRMSRTQESPLEFYVDVAQYFEGINKKLADQVRADLAYISRNNTKALRTLCYIYEAAGDYDKAALVYERILKVAPSEAQSYRDLALVYQEIGKYNEALELYYNMLGEQIKGVNFKGLEKSLTNELSHLLSLHKDQVDYERFPNEWLRTDFDIDIRMVIDWSDRTVPFEFQFVNPEKKFFKWTHTLEESRDRLEEEQAYGYQSEEFIIDDAPSGEWLINIQYLGDEGDYVLPPFLKYTVYRNYGTPQETKEIKVVKLFKQSDKVTLGKVVL